MHWIIHKGYNLPSEKGVYGKFSRKKELYVRVEYKAFNLSHHKNIFLLSLLWGSSLGNR